MAAASTMCRNIWSRRAAMPEHLIWFKWDAYATWLTGFAMLCVVYYAGAELYLIDKTVLDVSSTVAIILSIGSLVFGWIVYDLICRSPAGRSETGLMLLLYAVLVAMSWGYTQLFTGRAALLHLGAFTATIMSANVAHIIIPNQRKVVAALKAGQKPDPALGIQAKQRSTHNNYLTLPVIFLMLSIHYPLAFATEYNWLIASLVFLMGVTIRHYFNTYHAQRRVLLWPWAATLAIFAVIIWLSGLGTKAAGAGGGCGEPRAGPDAPRRQPGLRAGAGASRLSLRHVPRRGPRMAGHDHRAEGRQIRHRRTDRPARPRDLPAGRPLARHAAGQRHRDGGRRPRADREMV